MAVTNEIHGKYRKGRGEEKEEEKINHETVV